MKSDDQMMTFFKFDKPFINANSVNLGQVFSKYSKIFRYNDIIFDELNRDSAINMFTGFAYKEIITDDFTKIQLFLNHIKNVLAGMIDTELNYQYVIKRLASIYQKVRIKIGTLTNFIGSQGCEKSFAIEIIYELLGVFALKNVDELNKLFRKFNALASTAFLINFNEINDASESFQLKYIMKSSITQNKKIIEHSGMDPISTEMWENYTGTFNDANAIPIEKVNRRFQQLTCNNEFAGNREYFSDLCNYIKPTQQGIYNQEFMNTLLHYFRTLDIKEFNAEDFIVEVDKKTDVEYNDQLERQCSSLNQVDRFVFDNYPVFEIGVSIKRIKIDKYIQNDLEIKIKISCDFIVMRKNMFIKDYYLKNKYIYYQYLKIDQNGLPDQI